MSDGISCASTGVGPSVTVAKSKPPAGKKGKRNKQTEGQTERKRERKARRVRAVCVRTPLTLAKEFLFDCCVCCSGKESCIEVRFSGLECCGGPGDQLRSDDADSPADGIQCAGGIP